MRQFALRVLAILCALHVSGVHWAALQTVAWTGMLVSRAQEAGVEEAVRTTFDGEHPCSLCAVVEEGRKQEREKEPAPLVEQLAKLSFLRPHTVVLPAPSERTIGYRLEVREGMARSVAPATPPPRLS